MPRLVELQSLFTTFRPGGHSVSCCHIPQMLTWVIGKDGLLTGYRGGVDVKAKLLRVEGLEPATR